jgi:hypothetical protein
MAQLGSRLFFLLMDSSNEVTVEDLVASDEEVPYNERLSACKAAVHQCLTDLVQDTGVRGVPWPSTQDPRPMREWIARLATVLAAMRSEPVREVETAWGHALVHGRQHLSEADLPLVAQVAVSSMPSECALVFRRLVQQKEMTVGQVQAALGVKSAETARGVMEGLERRGVMEYTRAGPGKAAILRFRPEWAWCTSPEFQAIPLG